MIDRVGPYVEQLFENEDVQADLERAAARARQACAGARSRKNTKKVLTDSRARRRLGLWGLVKDEEAPRPKPREGAMAQMVLALLIQGAIARLVRGLVDHGTRHGWVRLTGAWPGEERPEQE